MIRLSVPEIEGGSPERDGGEGSNLSMGDIPVYITTYIIHFQISVWGSTGNPSELEVRVTEPLKEGDEITVLS